MAWTSWEKVQNLKFEDILYEKKSLDTGGSVARITINRPDKLNAARGQTYAEIARALNAASHDESVGVVVLTGAGDKAFHVGGDVQWELESGGGQLQLATVYLPNEAIKMCRKPVIAAVKGWCIGGGNHLAYFCDFTIAADNAVFGQNGPRIGSPADGYYVAYLTRILGQKKARELWMLCRRYTAQEALEMGLINAVAPLDKLDEEVDKWCEEILSKNPACIQILKATFDADNDYMRLGQAAQGNALFPNYHESELAKEGPAAFREKRKPNFWRWLKKS